MQVTASDILLPVSVLVLVTAAVFPWRIVRIAGEVKLLPRLVFAALAALALATALVYLLVPGVVLPGAVLLSPLISVALVAGVLALGRWLAASPAPRPHAYTLAQAADPASPAGLLRDIAVAAPELRAAVRANPSAYPDLVAWIDENGPTS